MSNQDHHTTDRESPSHSFGCACMAATARACYIVRYDIDPADDDLDAGYCECLCHKWQRATSTVSDGAA